MLSFLYNISIMKYTGLKDSWEKLKYYLQCFVFFCLKCPLFTLNTIHNRSNKIFRAHRNLVLAWNEVGDRKDEVQYSMECKVKTWRTSCILKLKRKKCQTGRLISYFLYSTHTNKCQDSPSLMGKSKAKVQTYWRSWLSSHPWLSWNTNRTLQEENNRRWKLLYHKSSYASIYKLLKKFLEWISKLWENHFEQDM